MDEQTPKPAQPVTAMPQFDPKDVEENKLMAALSYLGLLVLIPLLAKKDSKFAQTHAKQGLILCIAEFIFGIIPFLGWLLELVLLVVALIALINAIQGKFWKIPGAYDLGMKLNL